MIHTIRQLELMPCAAIGTILRGESGINLDTSRSGPCCLGLDEIQKHPPCCVIDAFINAAKIFFLHIVNRQIFNTYRIVFIHKLTSELMRKVMTFPVNSLIYARNYLASFTSGFSRFLSGGKFSLGFREGLFFLPEKTRVFNVFTVGERSKGFKAHINPNSRLNRLFDRLMVDITCESYKPFSGRCAPDSAGFNCAFNRSVKFDFNTADLGKSDNVFKQFEAKLRICERIVPDFATKPRISRLFTGLNPTKKGSESKIDSCGNVLENLAKNVAQKRIFYLERFKHIALVIARNTFLFTFPGCLSLLKKMVVQPTATIKGAIKSGCLAIRRIKPVFKSFSHGYTLMHDWYNVKLFMV